MTLHRIVKQTEKLVIDNSPAILTAIGVTGLLSTAYLTGKATFKAAEILRLDAEPGYVKDREITLVSQTKLVWKLYIPAISVAAVTTLAIVGSNRIGSRRAAAVAAAYSISERAFVEYKDKVVEHIGVAKETKIRDEVAQDRVNAAPVSNQSVIVTGGGEVLCMDAYSGRYFMSSMETMKKAQNDTNHDLLNAGYASLSDLYNRLGLDNTKISDDVGWNSDKLLDMTFSTTISDDQRPCIVMDFCVAPVRNFFRTH